MTLKEKFKDYRMREPKRNVMFVMFTDEVGEDENRLEDVITICKRNQMPVYVAGVPAPFGRPNIEIKYVDPDPNYDQSVQWIPVRQGPETFMPEQLQLNFSGNPNREDGIYRLDSGFGPYCLLKGLARIHGRAIHWVSSFLPRNSGASTGFDQKLDG